MIDWVKCSRNLPVPMVDVLIYYYGWLDNQRRVCVAYHSGELHGWRTVGSSGYECENDYKDEDVTHWAYLPGWPND